MTIAEQKFRLRLWGVLVFLTVLLGLIAIYALTDSAPPRDTTFLIETVPVADRDSVLAGLEEIHRALPEETLSVVWNALRDLPGDVPLFALSVEGIWRMSPAERAALPEQFVENLARAFAKLEATLSPLDEVLSRPQLGSDPWVVVEDSSDAFFDLRMVLSDRALLHRLQGDAAAASRELDRLRRMSSRFLFEGANLFEMLPAIHARLQCWQWAEDLLAQGELAPEVESQWLADRSVEEGLDELRSLLLATIYTRFRIDLSGVKSGEITTEFHPSTVSRYFKMNRTCESLSEGLHDLLDRARLPVPERTDEVLDWWHEGAELRMILRANAGQVKANKENAI